MAGFDALFLYGVPLAFVIVVAAEPVHQVRWCIDILRQSYATESVTVVTDGTKRYDVASFQTDLGFTYFEGEALKRIHKGAQWWHRWFVHALDTGSDVVVKLDADTWVRRALTHVPPQEVTGQLVGPGQAWEHIQGGFQCLRRSFIERVVFTGAALDPKYLAIDSWAAGDVRAMIERGEISTDMVLMRLITDTNGTWGPHPEIDSRWRAPGDASIEDSAWNPQACVTHPHKWDKQGFPI